METKSGGVSRLALMLAVQVVSNATHGARINSERAFRRRLYRFFRIERELLVEQAYRRVPETLGRILEVKPPVDSLGA